MKLPEDKKERAKVLILAGIGAVAVLYGAFVGVLKPARAHHEQRLTKLEKLNKDLRKARGQIGRMNEDRTNNIEAISAILDLGETRGYVHKARLGNFLLGAMETLERRAQEADLKLGPVREVGLSEIPHTEEQPNALKAYTVNVTLQTGLPKLARFFQLLEAGNPYLCVSRLSVAGRGDTPAEHRISFDIQWPVWANADMPERLREQLREAEGLDPEPDTPEAEPATAPAEEDTHATGT